MRFRDNTFGGGGATFSFVYRLGSSLSVFDKQRFGSSLSVFDFLHMQGDYQLNLSATQYRVNVNSGIPSIVGTALGSVVSPVVDAILALDGTSISEDGADLIPTLQDVVNTIFEMLDRVLASYVLLTVQVFSGLLSAVTHTTDMRAWGRFLKNTLTWMLQPVELVFKHAFPFIHMAMGIIPPPVGPAVSSVLGTLCVAIHKGIGAIFTIISSIPLVGSIVPDNNWEDDSMCVSSFASEKDDIVSITASITDDVRIVVVVQDSRALNQSTEGI